MTPNKFLEHIVFCALRGGIQNKIGVIRLKSIMLAPPKFLFWLRYCYQIKILLF